MARKPQATTAAAPVRTFAANKRQVVDFSDLALVAPVNFPSPERLDHVVNIAQAPASITPQEPLAVGAEIEKAFDIIAQLYGWNPTYQDALAQHLADVAARRFTPPPTMDGLKRHYVKRMEQLRPVLNGLCGVFLRDAHRACQYWQDQLAELRDMTRTIGDTTRDDREGVAGFATTIERKQEFVAVLMLRALQTWTMALEARKQLIRFTGQDFEPFREQEDGAAPTQAAADARAAALDS